MPLYLKKGDITRMHCDAIVNATDTYLSGGGGVDRMIHEAAGYDFSLECMKIGHCDVGKAVITDGCNLNAKYVIHTVGPIWSDGNPAEKELLASCYRNSLELALEYNCETIAFPLISAGTFGFPEDDAMQIAKAAIEEFLSEHDMTVYLVAYRSHTYNLGVKLFEEVRRYVEGSLADEFHSCTPVYHSDYWRPSAAQMNVNKLEDAAVSYSLKDYLDNLYLRELDESFAEMLARKIGERGMTNAECYNRALSTRSVFSKIKNNPDYHPTKATVTGYVFALELPFTEAKEMFEKAGYSLTSSNVFDLIIRWFIENGEYDIFKLNEVLLEYDQQVIGF